MKSRIFFRATLWKGNFLATIISIHTHRCHYGAHSLGAQSYDLVARHIRGGAPYYVHICIGFSVLFSWT